MQEEIKAAVQWWKQQLSGTPSHDAGDNDLNMWLMLMQARQPDNHHDNIEKFGEILTEKLLAETEQQQTSYPDEKPYLSLYTDYNPEDMLEDAADAAGVHGFPVKTIMSITPNKVTVAKGYGANRVCIYPAQAPTN